MCKEEGGGVCEGSCTGGREEFVSEREEERCRK